MIKTNVYIAGEGSMMLSSDSDTPEISISIDDNKPITVNGDELIQAVLKCMNLDVDVCEGYGH